MSAEPLQGQVRAQAQSPGHIHGHPHEQVHPHDHAHDHDGHAHSHHGPHTGHASHAHTPAPAVPAEPIGLDGGTPSLLMRSAGARVAGALLMICMLWLAVGWAVMERAP